MISLTSPARSIEERTTEATSSGLKVLAVIDGSERTGRIIDYAQDLRRGGHGPQVVVLGVVPGPLRAGCAATVPSSRRRCMTG